MLTTVLLLTPNCFLFNCSEPIRGKSDSRMCAVFPIYYGQSSILLLGEQPRGRKCSENGPCRFIIGAAWILGVNGCAAIIC